MTGWQRFLKFNGVAVLGMAVQLTVIAILGRRLHASAGVATAAGVSAAVLHNFVWHWRWTWGDRRGRDRMLTTLARFVLANGLVSLAGNLAIVLALVRGAGADVLTADVVAIAVCGIVNYAVSDRLVFSTPLIGPRPRLLSWSVAPFSRLRGRVPLASARGGGRAVLHGAHGHPGNGIGVRVCALPRRRG
ncbi:MAG: GtrA family protein [Acidobacteriota bacterium]